MGAGVVGLTCAVRLLEAGHRVDVLARDLPLETTSAVAAAFWYPYRALPQDKVTAWSATSYAVFDALADTDPESGVGDGRGDRGVHQPGAGPVVAHGRPVAGSADRRCRTGTSTAGRSCRRSSRCRSTCRGWPSRVEDLGGTITRMNLKALPTGRRRWSSTARGWAPACWRPTGRWCRCAARSCASSRPGSTALVGGPRGRPRTSSRGATTSSSAAPTTRASGAGRPRPETAAAILRRAEVLVPGAPGREGGPAQGRAAPGPPRRTPGAGRRRRALLRPRRRGRHPQLGRGRRGGRAQRLTRRCSDHQRDADQQATGAGTDPSPARRPTTADHDHPEQHRSRGRCGTSPRGRSTRRLVGAAGLEGTPG